MQNKNLENSLSALEVALDIEIPEDSKSNEDRRVVFIYHEDDTLFGDSNNVKDVSKFLLLTNKK